MNLATGKYEKEKQFHNKRFKNDTERQNRVSKFYKISGSVFKKYENVLLENCKDMSCLEYGCGLSNYIFKLAEYDTKQLTGIDISPVAIEQAILKAKSLSLNNKITFLTMNAENLEFSDNSYDLIFGTGILHHLDLRKALSSVARTLKPDGKAIFIEPMGHNILINRFRKKTPSLRTEDEHPLLYCDLLYMSKHFSNVKLEFYCFTSLAASFFSNKFFFKFMLRSLELLDQIIFKIPFLRKQAWLVLIVLTKPIKIE